MIQSSHIKKKKKKKLVYPNRKTGNGLNTTRSTPLDCIGYSVSPNFDSLKIKNERLWIYDPIILYYKKHNYLFTPNRKTGNGLNTSGSDKEIFPNPFILTSEFRQVYSSDRLTIFLIVVFTVSLLLLNTYVA